MGKRERGKGEKTRRKGHGEREGKEKKGWGRMIVSLAYIKKNSTVVLMKKNISFSVE